MNKRSFLQKLSFLSLIPLIDFRLLATPIKDRQYTLYTTYETKTINVPRIKISGSKSQILNQLEKLLKNKITNEACWCSIILISDGFNDSKIINYKDKNKYPFFYQTCFSWDRYMSCVNFCFQCAENKRISKT